MLSQTPSAFAALDEADARADDALALRYVVLGGERLAPSILAGWSSRHPLDRVRVINMYGITETTVHVTFRTMTPEDLTRPRLSPIGRALDDLDLYLLEPGSTEPAPLGVPGELCVGGAGVALGYLNRPERTAQSFIPHPFVPGEVLYRSGDQGIKLDSTDCFYLGRYDSQVKMRGFRIELGEIESVLLACPGVQRAAVSLADAGTDRARLTAHVVAQLPEAPGRQERGRQWEGIFDAAYSADDGQGRGDFRGWRSSYTGNRIAEEEMDEWAERTVARIRALRPRRVIEIGVGTGLLLTRLLGQVESYTALNVSSEAIERLRSPSAPNLRLLHREATDLDDLPEGGFDTVIINSVVQYFPDAAYTREVIERASRLVAPGGHIFVGDVRDLRSHLTFHRSLALARMAPDAPARRALMEADLSAARDREVVLDPDYFALLAHGNSRLDGAVVRPRLDECVNEMSKYRYDVVLRAAGAGPRSPSVSPEVLEPVDDVDELSRLLGAHRGTALAMRGLVDSRPAQDLTAAGILEEGGASTVAQVRARASGTARGMTPGDALRAATALGRSARVVASREGAGLFDLLVDASPDDELWVPRRVMDPHRLANDPTVAHRQDILIRDLHDQLARKLPEYMLPSDMTVVDEIPLTVNGKTDLEALPRSAETRTARAGLDGADTAPQTATERAVAGIFASMLHLQQVGADADFFALGGHSLLVARFAYAVADELGVALPLRVIFEDSTVRGIARAIDEAASGNRHEPDLMTEAGRWTPPVPAVRTGPAGPARSLLVTGATGFLGAHVLAEALERTDAVVHCVVRARDDTGARERVETALRRYGLAVPERNRMRVCGGDLSQPHLGLTQPAYDRLVDELDLVYHVAADTTLVVPYSRLRETNVEGTSRVLELAAAAAAPVHYVSTVGVFAPTGEVRTEQSPTGPVEGLSTAYAQSKWVAEQRVLRARASGLPVSIYRPARITGSTTTGACRPDDLFWRVVLGAIQLSEVPADPGLRVDLVAVDEVAAAIVDLSVGGYVGETYHLSHGTGTSLDAVVRVLRGLGYRLGRTTMDRWLGRLKGEPGNAAASLVPLLDWQGALDIPLSSESTRRALNEVDASLRPVTDEMLARTVEFFIRTGQFPRPGTSRP